MLEVSGVKPLIETTENIVRKLIVTWCLFSPYNVGVAPPPPPGVGPVITVCLCSCLIPRTEAPTLMDGVVIGEG